MKTKTEIILIVLKYLALLGGIGFSIECGSEIVALVVSYVNPEWAKNVYKVNLEWLRVRDASMWYYTFGMSIVILTSALKATVWYFIYELLQKIQLHSPFTMIVTRKLENVAFLLFGIWVFSGFFLKTYLHYLSSDTGIHLSGIESAEEYFFIAGIVYIISQIFKRGIEIQEENSLTV